MRCEYSEIKREATKYLEEIINSFARGYNVGSSQMESDELSFSTIQELLKYSFDKCEEFILDSINESELINIFEEIVTEAKEEERKLQ